MTGKTFRFHVVGTIVLVIVASGLSLYESSIWVRYTDALKAAPAVFIPIGAAWLAFCWQRRVAFTKALFDTWQKIVTTVQDAIQYTLLPNPTQPDFAKIMHSLSCRIDDIRGAFRNVDEPHIKMSDETKQFVLAIKGAKTLDECAIELKKYKQHKPAYVGLYPFESLKQIQQVIERLGFNQRTPQQAQIANQTIIALWQILRRELLKELDRDFPEYPDTPFTSRIRRWYRHLLWQPKAQVREEPIRRPAEVSHRQA
jgi:hypothetical protein